MSKPRLCEILGFNRGETFYWDNIPYYIDAGGYLRNEEDNACIVDADILCEMIEHPEMIQVWRMTTQTER